MPPSTTLPETFARAVRGLRAARLREGISVEEIAAPRRLAPYSFALAAAAHRDGDEVATGRLVLLHDPAGHESWEGTLRLVSYVTAQLETDLAGDPLLPAVGWSWLTEGLDGCAARYVAAAGTVTQTTSTRFGDLAGQPGETSLEIRASWTPIGMDLGAHLSGWCALLASMAGLPPPGVATLAERRTAG